MHKRWYDQDPSCTKMLTHIKSVKQMEVQEFCGRMLGHFTDQMRKQIQYKNHSGLTSIGLPGIEYLYKFRQQQRRWYDKVKPVQLAVGSMYTLPKEGLAALGFTVGDTFGLISVYSQVCFEIGQPPLTHDLVTISKKALHEGRDQAIGFVKELVGDDLFDALYVQ